MCFCVPFGGSCNLANNKKQERYSDGSPEKTCPVCAPWLGWIYDGVNGSSGCNVENEDNLRIIVSMPYYYAEFQQLGDDYFRLDTRIYLEEGDHVKKSGQGIAAIVAKNPGSARPRNGFGIWEGLCLGNDKMLPAVRHVFVKAYALREKPIPQGAYVQVLNLSYYCSERIALLFKFFKTGRPALTCAGRTRTFPIVWFAWTRQAPRSAKVRLLPDLGTAQILLRQEFQRSGFTST